MGLRVGTKVLAAAAFAAGIGSTDPVEHAIATYESDIMGDPNFSQRILGRQMGGYGLIGGLGGIIGIPNKTVYYNQTSLNNGVTLANMRSRGIAPPPGSMVFGMFNSRMA